MPMPDWQDQPANREYKRKLRDLQIPIPRWWPGRMNIEIVGGDLETGAVVAHLPVEGNPYFARVPAHSPTGGNTDVTLADLDRNHVRTEWVDGDWKYIVFGREELDAVDVGHIRISMRSISLEVSSRAVTFDPTDHELFVVQALRFRLATATERLRPSVWRPFRTRHRERTPGRSRLCGALPRCRPLARYCRYAYGPRYRVVLSWLLRTNLDALNDCLGDVGRYSYGSESSSAGTVLAIAGFDSLLDIDRPTALGVLDVFARQARLSALYGHAMLCLVETAGDELGKVGGTDVSQATVTGFPPDPPEPFDESTIIEFGFQFYATADEAEDLALRLESATAPILDEVGRYCTRVDLASERAGQSDERHSSSFKLRGPGQDLYEICIATRGTGDRSVLGERIFEAVTGRGLPFEQMSETPFGGPFLADAFEKYPSLG
ncbi:MAG: hypothetical protein WBC54_19480 [Rhodococcus sp. (in: high G+C Gram-positive bacteria)]